MVIDAFEIDAHWWSIMMDETDWIVGSSLYYFFVFDTVVFKHTHTQMHKKRVIQFI